MARILVVDDEPDVRELFNITLKMAGHTTDTAKDGLEAVDKLKDDQFPDLILLDLMMPRMDGFAFLSHIRQELPARPVRVLIATAKVLEDADHEKLSSWPVVGVLNKGEIDIGQMVIIISSALSKSPHKNGDASSGEKETDKQEPEKQESKEQPAAGQEKNEAGKPGPDKPDLKPDQKPGV
nr:response regulator [Anaerolineae bacterium]